MNSPVRNSARRKASAVLLILGLLVGLNVAAAIAQSQNRTQAAGAYYPGAGQDWQQRSAEQVGIDPTRLKAAIDFAIASESKAPRNLELAHYQTFGREPFGEGVGPFKERGDPTGLIIRNGYIVAEWGDPHRVDMTYSVTKSFVSTTVGLAFDRGLIRDVQDRVRDYMAPVVVLAPGSRGGRAERLGESEVFQPFETEHNRKLTWDHLLRQTSDWEGTLWGKPEWADRPGQNPAEWRTRKRNQPGAVYEYNDVRVNVLALAALNVWRRPLPQVLKETSWTR